MKNKIISVILVIVMFISSVPISTVVYAATNTSSNITIEYLQNKYPHGAYWNGGNPETYTFKPCTHHGNCSKGNTDYSGWCGCNSYRGVAIQCNGFAYQLASIVYGGDPYNDWDANYNSSALESLKAGDIVRYKNNGHTIFITNVNGDTVTYADCNSVTDDCNIKWNQTIPKSTLKDTFYYLDPAPYAWNGGVLTPDTVNGIRAYTLETGKTTIYTSINGSAKTNKIYDTDLCTIDSIKKRICF